MFRLFKWALRGAVISALLLSLAINIASFVGGALWTTASLAWEGVTGARSYLTSQTDKIDLLDKKQRAASKRVESEVSSKRKLRKKLTHSQSELLGAQNKILKNERVIKELRGDLSVSASRKVTYKGRKMLVTEAVSETADKVSRRAAKTATREIASMPGEAIPFWGTAVIVGVTSLEVYDLCETIKDMNALKRAFDPTLEPDPNETTVCSMRVPTREELWQATKSAPGAAWASARESVPSLEDIREWDLPKVDASQIWENTKGGAARMTGWVTENSASAGAATVDTVKDIGSSAIGAAATGISALKRRTKGLLSSDED